MIIKVSISDLAKGHFVVDIAEQCGTYNLTRAGHIKSHEMIKDLQAKGVESVLIDTSKSIHDALTVELAEQDAAAAPLTLEVNKAQKLFNQSKQLQQQLFFDLQQGRTMNIGPLIDATQQTINAIFKNPDALICVINIRNKNQYLLEHSVSVAILMSVFAQFLKIEKNTIQQLAIGALLHDVGKIKIPDGILNKAGKLTRQEYLHIQEHVKFTIEIIKSTPNISPLSLEVAALHHERLDGSGYPLKLKQSEISNYGLMIAICDTFDALTADRCYKDGYTHIKAFSILRKLAHEGKLMPRMVDLFIKCLGVYPVGSLVELNSRHLAIVESRNQDDPINPKVRCFYNLDSRRYIMAKDINLAKESDFIIRGVKASDHNLDMNRIIEFLLLAG
ncbi:metal dependent phosphohydrolase [Colwellia chukchiensis]|uniref:Metal dependent phosphohydrolase n=1 Tax=Colwellia chukchiensis TaxID=641665 RepID=A0A1H7LCQ0_9GAMM|nr:HD-GYP domain-containing protein [Colwellia chukchiensis]SEK96714.1 metal dependent phosphohydrolase [Colwellia chukchiensis]